MKIFIISWSISYNFEYFSWLASQQSFEFVCSGPSKSSQHMILLIQKFLPRQFPRNVSSVSVPRVALKYISNVLVFWSRRNRCAIHVFSHFTCSPYSFSALLLFFARKTKLNFQLLPIAKRNTDILFIRVDRLSDPYESLRPRSSVPDENITDTIIFWYWFWFVKSMLEKKYIQKKHTCRRHLAFIMTTAECSRSITASP